ncbi:hypothetical protein Q5482_24775 [Escherichia coli]|uniref:hypothetical protein n=1 Tax=Escherichia coli TaxID=562 RepID=UPI001602FD65|nr:hypothetical protein [Escherichia coli]MBV4715386.1 hypothetical protein [Escherichia coli]MDF1235935.1 hypothetical protein [Escherichia coli]MDZ6604340.1 hypothetical protein [Escherichia coli]MED8223904.1 hypothetical protein [Escherichia coli]UGH34465.1 hypothetical protein LQT91_25610 [Escherichia coli]
MNKTKGCLIANFATVPIDLIVVDDRDRQPIGRPYLTLAIDVFTRCVLGMVVTLEAPSAPIYCSQR